MVANFCARHESESGARSQFASRKEAPLAFRAFNYLFLAQPWQIRYGILRKRRILAIFSYFVLILWSLMEGMWHPG
jgi:hypothetical protein